MLWQMNSLAHFFLSVVQAASEWEVGQKHKWSQGDWLGESEWTL